MKRLILGIISLLVQFHLNAQTQYDYYDDSAVVGGADRVLNGIIIIGGLALIVVILILFIGGALNVYYWFNPKANPKYKQAMAKKEQEKRHEEYVQEQRQKATYEYVDLGLSVKWATFNLGAYKPSDVGSTFYWAENQAIKGHHEYGNVDVNALGNIGGNERYDAATKIIGKNWRLPTVEECQELIDLCKWETKVIDSIEGRLVTGPSGNSIFLPYNRKDFATGKYISGYYWTSSPRFGNNNPYDLRFGEDYKLPAEIWWGATANRCLFGIRPVFTTITREIIQKQKQTEEKKAYAQIPTNRLNDSDMDYYLEQCNIRDEEKKQKTSYLRVCFAEHKIQRDEHGVIYSLDGKRLLDGSACDCKTYKIKEGTEFVCNYAFKTSFLYSKQIVEKIVLPSSLIYFPTSAIQENCLLESNSPYYSIINDLLIDTRKKSVVKCLNKYIQQVKIYEPIEEICDDAFVRCTVLREVYLPNSIKKIGQNAFQWCNMLCKISFPNSIEIISQNAFYHCKNLHIRRLPNNLYRIGDSAFKYCIIDDIIIPKGVKEIGKTPFSKEAKNISSESSRFVIVNSLLIDSDNNELIQLVDSTTKRVAIPDNVTKIRLEAFISADIEAVIIPSSVKELGEAVFWNCQKMIEVQLNCEIDRLPYAMFAYCSSLTTFNVPNNIKIIESKAFSDCKNLHEIILNKGLRIIGNCAFEECSNLTSLSIPESVEKIGDTEYCFKGCNNLNEIYYDASKAELTGLPYYMTRLTIGPHVNTLPKNFLINNKVLESIVIPNNVQRVEKGCIVGCSTLKDISILSKDIILEEEWIRDCENLQIIRIPVDIYETLLPYLPHDKKLKIKKIYNHQFLFFKW